MPIQFPVSLFHRHTCNIARPSRTTDSSTGVVGDETYASVATAVACHYVLTQNDDDANEAAGRIKRRTALTEDEIHFATSVDIRSGDFIKNTTASSKNLGTVHRVMGAARALDDPAGLFDPHKQVLKLMEIEHVPSSLATALAG